MEKRDNFLGGLVVIAVLIVVGFFFTIKGNDLEQLIGIVVMTGGALSGIPMQLMLSRK